MVRTKEAQTIYITQMNIRYSNKIDIYTEKNIDIAFGIQLFNWCAFATN